MHDPVVLSTVASTVAILGSAMLVFRIQRENDMAKLGQPQWIPWADWLLLGATATSLLLVIFPIVMLTKPLFLTEALPSAACAASVLAVAAYPLALLAHYRLLFRDPEAETQFNYAVERYSEERRRYAHAIEQSPGETVGWYPDFTRKSEPWERRIVIATVVLAVVVFGLRLAVGLGLCG